MEVITIAGICHHRSICPTVGVKHEGGKGGAYRLTAAANRRDGDMSKQWQLMPYIGGGGET
jgi:hypothetical protein